MNVLRKIKRIRAGIERRIRKALGMPTRRYDQFTAIQTKFFDRGGEVVILDVGAHVGESVERFRTVFPHSVIHTFEPDQDNFTALLRNHSGKKNVHFNNVGVGSKQGKAQFFRNLKSDTSSFNRLAPGTDWIKLRSSQHNVTEQDFTQKSYEVPIRTLDSYISEKKIAHVNLLKMDTQGYEDEVLKGAENSLKSGIIDMVETELIVGDMYQKTMSFSDIEALLLPYGYKFYAIDTSGDLLRHPSLSFNLIYIRKALLESPSLKKAA